MKLTILSFFGFVNAAHLFMEMSSNHSLGKRLTLMFGYFEKNAHFSQIYPHFRRYLENNISDPAHTHCTSKYLRLDDQFQELLVLIKEKTGKRLSVEGTSATNGCLRILESLGNSDPNLQTLCRCIAHYTPDLFTHPSKKKKGSLEESVLLDNENIWVNSLEFNIVLWALQISILNGFSGVLEDHAEITTKFASVIKEYHSLKKPYVKRKYVSDTVAEAKGNQIASNTKHAASSNASSTKQDLSSNAARTRTLPTSESKVVNNATNVPPTTTTIPLSTPAKVTQSTTTVQNKTAQQSTTTQAGNTATVKQNNLTKSTRQSKVVSKKQPLSTFSNKHHTGIVIFHLTLVLILVYVAGHLIKRYIID